MAASQEAQKPPKRPQCLNRSRGISLVRVSENEKAAYNTRLPQCAPQHKPTARAHCGKLQRYTTFKRDLCFHAAARTSPVQCPISLHQMFSVPASLLSFVCASTGQKHSAPHCGHVGTMPAFFIAFKKPSVASDGFQLLMVGSLGVGWQC